MSAPDSLKVWIHIRQLTENVTSAATARIAGLLLGQQAAEDQVAEAFVEGLAEHWRVLLARALGYLPSDSR